jgi:long-chain acyl-CoA synthetase
LATVYGMTETHGVIMMNGGEDLRKHPTSVGHPLPYFDVKIVDGDCHQVVDGALGEISLYGPTITPGYWDDPEATAAAIRDGWLYTGDVGYRDADGFYYLVDRTKDIIIRGGENVYSVEIENCLAEHPQIDEAAVIGVPDPELGERVKAILYPVRGATLTVEAVRAHVAARLASFKVPEIIEISERPLPRNPAGKILKDQLRGGGGGYFADDALE